MTSRGLERDGERERERVMRKVRGREGESGWTGRNSARESACARMRG